MNELEALLAGGLGGADATQLWSQGIGAAPPSAAPPETPSWFRGFMGSAVQSIPELVGRPDWGAALSGVSPEQVETWRTGNPLSSFASQVLPAVLPYGLAARGGAALASRVAPAAWEALGPTSAAGIARPIATAWKRGAVELLPFEVARVATAAAIGDVGSLDDVALSAGLDIATLPVLPAAWKAIQMLRPEEKSALRELGSRIPGLGPDQPNQTRLSTVYDMLSKGNKDLEKILTDAQDQLELGIRKHRAATPLEDLEYGDKKALEKFFKSGVKKGEDGAETSATRLLYQAEADGYPNPKAWQDEISPLALPKDWLAYSELPRVTEAKTAAKAAGFEKDIQGNMSPTVRGWYMTKETDTGLYVMAKKVAGAVDKTAEGDKWFTVKTSRPDRFLGEDVVGLRTDRAVKFSQRIKMAEDRAVLEKFKDQLQGSVVGMGRAFDKAIPLEKVRAFSNDNYKRAIQFLDTIRPGAGEALSRAGSDLGDAMALAKRFVAPAMAQFRKTPMAESVRLRGQARFDSAEAQANALLYGQHKADDWARPIAKLAATKFNPDGMLKVFEGIKDEDMKLVTKLLNDEVPVAKLGEALRGLTDDTVQHTRVENFLKTLHDLDSKINQRVTMTENLYNEPKTDWMEGHYGINHTWVGSLRRKIVDEKGALIAVASGRNTLEVDANAKKLQQIFGGSIRPERLVGQEADDALVKELMANRRRAGVSIRMGLKPGEMSNEREGVRGFLGDVEPLTKKELFDILANNVKRKFHYQAELSVKHDLTPDILESYSRYGKEVGDQLVMRLNQMAGRKGALDRATNEAVTRVLGKHLGNNAADKLVGTYNRVEGMLTLMAGNLAHAGLQGLSFIQTVLPKVAMFRGAPPARWGEIMGIMPEFGPNGDVIGTISALDPVRMTSKAIAGLVRPDAGQRAALARAANDAVIAPRFLEEFVGQKSIFGSSVRDAALSGNNPVTKFLLKLAEYPAAKMEELSRAHAFLTGDMLAKKLAPEASQEWHYQFAKQFTFRTMYQYSAADKPRMFAGPLGGAFGLFKNWMFHNVADWSQYAGEAFLRNNWQPLLWAAGGQVALAGGASLPLVGLANGAYKMFNNSSAMQDLYENFGSNRWTDAAYFGLPAFLGVSLQGNASGPFSNPVRDINYLFNAAILDRAKKVSQLVGYVSQQHGLGYNPFESDRTWDLASYALGPRILYKSMAQVEDGALKAIRNGAPIIEGITYPETLMNAVGLTPLKIAKAYELSEELWANREKARAQSSRLGEAFAQALGRGDQRTMNFVVGTAVAHGYDVSSVLRSATARLRDQALPAIPYDFRKDPMAWKGLEALGLGG